MSSLCNNTLWKYERKPCTYHLLFTFTWWCSDRQRHCNQKPKPPDSFQWEHCVGTVLVQRASASDAGWSNRKSFYVCHNAMRRHREKPRRVAKILKTKQHDITTNSKITPESTPLNTISTEVNIIWTKDLLQGCGRDHWFMATPNKQQGSVFCSWKNWAKQPLKKRHFLAACCTALWSYPRVLMQDRCRSVGSVLNLNESIPTYIKYYILHI